MKKKVMIKLMIVLVIVVAIVASLLMFYTQAQKPTGTKDEMVLVNVESGETYYSLLDTLEAEGLINNALVAKIYLKLNNISQLQANNYELNKGMSLSEIIEVVSTGDFNYLVKYRMTVPEGLTILEVAEIVAKQTGSTKDEVIAAWDDKTYVSELCNDYWFLNEEEILDEEIFHPLEGYLYPETYTLTTDTPTIDYITRTMLDMTGKTLEKYKSDIENLDFTVHEFLSFAAVVERESLFDKDRPSIAGVFMNRLKDGWNLESDITVLYVLGRTGVKLSNAEIQQANSPYNTYLYNGLPVGPISNVSEVTIQSCIDYEEHDYYFFFAKEDGTVVYGRNLAEHNANIDKYLWY